MNKRQKEVIQTQLDNEKAVLKKLEANYKDALDEINSKIELLMARQDADMQHVIYQVEYQKALKTQVQAILENLQTNEFETVSEYLAQSYEDGFIGTMYDLQGQGIPLIFPIDQEQVVAAIQHETKLSENLYTALGKDVKDLSKKIAGEISRGISGGQMYSEIARNIASWAMIPKNNAMRIARTEAHRIQSKATADAQFKAKEKGADVLKQWDAAMDRKTRKSHRELDGQIRELEEPFEVNGHKAMHPGGFGIAKEDINCRCVLLQRARWALGNDYTKWSPNAPVVIDDDGTTQFTILEAKNYEDFQKKYKQASERVREGAQKMKVQKTKEPTSVDEVNAIGTDMLENAYEEHRLRNDLNLVPASELGDEKKYAFNADYGKMSLKSAKAYNDTLEKLISEYDTSLKHIRPMDKNEYVRLHNAFVGVEHDYKTDSSVMLLNISKLKDLDKLEERIKTLAENGHCVEVLEDKLAEYVPTHEFAHTLLGMTDPLSNKSNWAGVDYKKIKDARKEIDKAYKEYMNDIASAKEKLSAVEEKLFDLSLSPSEIEEYEKQYDILYEEYNSTKISDYSMENSDEFMAEAFTQAKIGTKTTIYSDKVLEVLDKYFKK